MKYEDYYLSDTDEAEAILVALSAVAGTTSKQFAPKRKRLADGWYVKNLDAVVNGTKHGFMISGASSTDVNGGGRRKLLEDMIAAGCRILKVSVFRLGDIPASKKAPVVAPVAPPVATPTLTPVEQAVEDAKAVIGIQNLTHEERTRVAANLYADLMGERLQNLSNQMIQEIVGNIAAKMA